jgi:type II secretory pathway pseudopilin PulG
MKKMFSSKSGMSLIDAIIATTIIAIAATGAMTVVRVSLSGITLNQDRLSALSFAREGIETVRSIRDTNQLRYGSNDDCWNTLEATSISDCEDILIADSTYYMPKFDLDDKLVYLDESSDDVFDGDNQLYECSELTVNPDSIVDCTETDFYRIVYIEYDDILDPSYMTITSTVGWISGGEQKTAYLIDKIYKP